MDITPSTEKKKPNYPALLAAAVVVSAALASCDRQTPGTPIPPPQATPPEQPQQQTQAPEQREQTQERMQLPQRTMGVICTPY